MSEFKKYICNIHIILLFSNCKFRYQTVNIAEIIIVMITYYDFVQLYKTLQSLNGSAKFGFHGELQPSKERTRFHFGDLLLNFLNSGQLQLILLPEDHESRQ